MDEDIIKDLLKLLPSLCVDEDILKPYLVNEPPKCTYNIDTTIFHEYDQKYYDSELVHFEVHKRTRDHETDLPGPTSDTNICEEKENATSNPELTKNEQSGVVINSKTYLKDHNWNTLLSLEGLFQCAVCDEIMPPNAVDDHISTVSHKINLERYSPMSHYELSVVRKIENFYHCGVCNLLLEEIYNHMKIETHKQNYLNAMKKVSDIVSDSVLAINIPLHNESEEEIIKFIDKNVSALNSNRSVNIVPANNVNVTKPPNSKPILNIGVVKNKPINLNASDQVNSSKVPSPNINKTKSVNKKAPAISNRKVNVPFPNLIKPAKNTKPLQSLTPININQNYDMNFPDLNRPVNNPQILTPGSNNDLANSKLDKAIVSYKDKTSQKHNEVNKKPVQNKTSNKIQVGSVVNQSHIGKVHNETNNSQGDTSVSKPNTSYASAAKKYVGVGPEHVTISNGNVTVTVKYDCWHMIITRRNRTFYCMACSETNISDKLIHCSCEGHLQKLKQCTIVEAYETFFIRKVDKFYHCSHCNILQYPPDIARHIAKEHPQVKQQTNKETNKTTQSSDPIKSVVFTATAKNVNDAHRCSNSPDSVTSDRSDSTRSTDSPKTHPDVVPNPTMINSEIKIRPFDLEMTINVLYYNVIFILADKLVCGLCDCLVPMDPVQHICGTRHMEILRLAVFIPRFNNNLIREIRGRLHCALCNVYATNENIFTHIMNLPHTALLSKATSHIGAPASNVVPNVPPVGQNINPVRNPMYGWWQTTPQYTGNRILPMIPLRAPIVYTRPAYPYLIQRWTNPIMPAQNVINIPNTDTKTPRNNDTFKIKEINEATCETNVMGNGNASTNVMGQEIESLEPTFAIANTENSEKVGETPREVEKVESNSRNKGEETESPNDIPQEIKSLVPIVAATNTKTPERVEVGPKEVEQTEPNSRNDDVQPDSTNVVTSEIKPLIPTVSDAKTKVHENVEKHETQVNKNDVAETADCNDATTDIGKISKKGKNNLDIIFNKKAKEKSKRINTRITKESNNSNRESAATKTLFFNVKEQNLNDLISKEINPLSINYTCSREKEYTLDITNVLKSNVMTENINTTMKLNKPTIIKIENTLPLTKSVSEDKIMTPDDITSQLKPDPTETETKLSLDEQKITWDDSKISNELSLPKTDDALNIIGVTPNKNKLIDSDLNKEKQHSAPTNIFTNKELIQKLPTLDKNKNTENIFKDDFFVHSTNTLIEPSEDSELHDPEVKQNICTLNDNIITLVGKEAALDKNKYVGGSEVNNVDEITHVFKKPTVDQHLTILNVNKKTKVKEPKLDRNTNDDCHKNKHSILKRQLKNKSFLKKNQIHSKVAGIKTPKNVSKAKKLSVNRSKANENKNKSKRATKSADTIIANATTDNENENIQNEQASENDTPAVSIDTGSNINEFNTNKNILDTNEPKIADEANNETTLDRTENISNEEVSKVTPDPSIENVLNVNKSDTNENSLNTYVTERVDSNLELVESINDDALSRNESTSDLNEVSDSTAPYYIEEFVYLKHNNHIAKITFSSYNSLVPVGDGTRYCFVCWNNVLCGELKQHVESSNHLENMRSTKYMDHYYENMIRWKNSSHHCSLCNVIITGSVETHLNWQHHLTALRKNKKSARQLVKDRKKHKCKQFKTYTTNKTYSCTNPVTFKTVPCDNLF